MRNTALAALALSLLAGRGASAAEHRYHGPGPGDTLGAAAFPSAASQADRAGDWQRGLDVRVWTEDAREVYDPGDRTRVFFRATRDAYVAVLHIDTNGNLQVLFPSSPRQDGRVTARRMYALPNAGGMGPYWTVDGNPGIGYLFTVASAEPLEFRNIRGAFGYRPAARADGRAVYGDPYDAIERIAHLLVPDWYEVDRALDVYAYHVGGRFTHPRYACYDGYGSWAYSRSASYGSCERVRLLLGHDPGYFDARGFDASFLEQRREEGRDTRTYSGRTGGDAIRIRGGSAGDAPPVRDLRPSELRRTQGGREGERRRDPSPSSSPSSRGTQAPAVRRDPPERARPTLERRRSGGESAPPPARPASGGNGGNRTPSSTPSSPPRTSPSPSPAPSSGGGSDRGRPGGAF